MRALRLKRRFNRKVRKERKEERKEKTTNLIPLQYSMETKVDMTYRFLWDSEPTDEQLLVLMQEVGEEVRQNREKVAKQVLANIQQESVRVRAAQTIQQ